MDILFEQEKVELDQLLGHGGFFKTEEVGQRIMAAAMNVPVSVMETAGEGGAWGIALLAAYMHRKGAHEPLEAYLSGKVFAGQQGSTITPDPAPMSLASPRSWSATRMGWQLNVRRWRDCGKARVGTI